MRHLAGAVTALLVLEVSAAGPTDAESEELRRLDHVLTVLETGTRAERLALFKPGPAQVMEPFQALRAHSGRKDAPAAESVVRAVERVRRYIAAEQDIWVLDHVAAELKRDLTSEASEIFADLSRHPAPSLRHRAVDFASSQFPDGAPDYLWAMWPGNPEDPPWLRGALLLALLVDDPELVLEGCRKLVWDEHLRVAAPAMFCLTLAETDETSLLLRRATEGSGAGASIAMVYLMQVLGESSEPTAIEARTTLEAMWHDEIEAGLRGRLLLLLDDLDSSTAASIAMRHTGDDEHPDLALAAISIVAQQRTRESSRLLLARAQEGSPRLRAAALSNLHRGSYEPGLERVLLEATDSETPLEVRRAAVRAMEWVRGMEGAPEEIGRHFAERLAVVAADDPDPTVRASAATAALNARAGGGAYCWRSRGNDVFWTGAEWKRGLARAAW